MATTVTRDYTVWHRRLAMAGTDQDQFKIAATGSRIWRPGDMLSPGQIVGDTIHGTSIQVTAAGWITDVQYDVETNEVILTVEPIPGSRCRDAQRGEPAAFQAAC